MPTCRRCGTDSRTEDLVRHRHHHLLVVHCPECRFVMGVWRDPTADDLAAAEESG